MNTWTLINYFDVWGNKKDGFEVNNSCTEADDIVLADDINNQDLLKYLKMIRFFKKHVRLNMLEIMWDCGYIEIFAKKDGMPLCRFEENQPMSKGE